MTSYFRVGGIAMEPPVDFYERVQKLLDIMPSKIDEYQNLLTGNPIWISRTKGVGHLSAEDAIALGVTGPPLRASGVDWDLRRDMPYSGYEKFQFKVPISNDCDVWARYVIRMEEMRESVKICQQALDGMPEGPIKADAPKVVLPDREVMKTQMEVAHLSLQDCHGRLRGAGRRGLPGHRIAARRNGLLRRLRRHGQTLSRAHAQSFVRNPAGRRQDVRRPAAGRCGRGHRLDRHRAWGDRPVSATAVGDPIDPAVARELWASFVSLLRSYTAAHGLNGTRQAVLEVSDDHLLVRAGERLLTMRFDGEHGSFTRETGSATEFTLDEHGRVIQASSLEGPGNAEEMDMVAERLAREIMR